MTQTLTEPRPLSRETARAVRDRLTEGPITAREIREVWNEETRRGRRTGRLVRVAR
jgi:hypothetical protein